MLLPLPEWPPGVVASSGRTRAGVSPVLPRDCWSRAGQRQTFLCPAQGAQLACAVLGRHQAAGSDLSLCGESRRESTESRYCVMGLRESSMQKAAPRRARASTHAGLLHLLVPTEDSIIPDWESEVRLSVRSKLQVWLSCLWTKPHMDSEQGIPTNVFSKELHAGTAHALLCTGVPFHSLTRIHLARDAQLPNPASDLPFFATSWRYLPKADLPNVDLDVQFPLVYKRFWQQNTFKVLDKNYDMLVRPC